MKFNFDIDKYCNEYCLCNSKYCSRDCTLYKYYNDVNFGKAKKAYIITYKITIESDIGIGSKNIERTKLIYAYNRREAKRLLYNSLFNSEYKDIIMDIILLDIQRL